MLIALFRPHQRERKAWIARLRESGYTVQIVHDPERIAQGTAIIVIDRSVGRWKDFVRMVDSLEIPIVLLADNEQDLPEDWKLLHVAGIIRSDTSTDQLFERILANQTNTQNQGEKAPAFPYDETSLVLPERKSNSDEAHPITSESRTSLRKALSQHAGDKTLSQRQATRELDADPSAQDSERLITPGPLPDSEPVSVQGNGDDSEAMAKKAWADRDEKQQAEPEVMVLVQASNSTHNPLVRDETIGPHPPVVASRPSANMPAVAAVYAAKGGVGKTTFLLHMAARLAKEGQRVCVVDMDLLFGTVAAMLNMKPPKTIVDLLQRIEDPKASRACLLPTEPGFLVVAAPLQPGRFRLEPAQLLTLLGFLKEETDLVLIDLPAAFDSLTRQVLQASDQLFLMTTDEPASLLNLERVGPLLAGLRPSPESWLVWNRLTAPAPHVLWKERLPWPTALELPEDATVTSAVRRGEWIPVSPTSPYRLQMGRLVDPWLGKEPDPSAGSGKNRLLKRWLFK
ncbi:AAA family ATPase [Cohnella fermenti]|uniref:AAA domain-containing protein n=1 Tax=Cohnella fermenti TaxID=2565925 RepID=A0A4S4BIY9_9BACL|nr:AAA family ATPase [Cohnella fermenti]THF74379.1 hypothetical protein E6C55_25385 [Cohnella fermenti]